jgi:hypothetical protein
MKTLQYIIVGGQLQIDKRVFAGELLLPDSSLKKILHPEDIVGCKQPTIVKMESHVFIDFNDASDIILDEGFADLFKKLKFKYKEKIKGKVVIRITALSSYHMVLNLSSDDDKVIYE